MRTMRTESVEYIPWYEESLMHIPPHHDVLLERELGIREIRGDVILTLDDVPILMRMDVPEQYIPLLDDVYSRACRQQFTIGGVKRVHTGMSYEAIAWGAVEARVVRQRMAGSMSKWSVENPEFHERLTQLIQAGWDLLERECREMWYAISTAPQALPIWRIRDTPFTSGVINHNAALAYHRDRGNVAATGSVMWVARDGVRGGHLHIPSLNLLVNCRHGTLLIFYGEKFWHGVTRMRLSSKRTRCRISVVAYSKQGILKAASPVEEHKRAAVQGTKSMDDIRDTVIKYT